MKHSDLIELGFILRGIEEEDPYYNLMFTYPFNFNIQSLSGVLNEEVFWLYGNDTKYTDKDELKKLIDVVGNEIYVIQKFK
jgi:hypothetical protein